MSSHRARHTYRFARRNIAKMERRMLARANRQTLVAHYMDRVLRDFDTIALARRGLLSRV